MYFGVERKVYVNTAVSMCRRLVSRGTMGIRL